MIITAKDFPDGAISLCLHRGSADYAAYGEVATTECDSGGNSESGRFLATGIAGDVIAVIVSLYGTILEKMEPQPDTYARWQALWQERFESRRDLISRCSMPQPTARSRAKKR